MVFTYTRSLPYRFQRVSINWLTSDVPAPRAWNVIDETCLTRSCVQGNRQPLQLLGVTVQPVAHANSR